MDSSFSEGHKVFLQVNGPFVSRLATSAGRHCVVAGLALFSIWGPWFSGVAVRVTLPAVILLHSPPCPR